VRSICIEFSFMTAPDLQHVDTPAVDPVLRKR
jgi:hypothetical protein